MRVQSIKSNWIGKQGVTRWIFPSCTRQEGLKIRKVREFFYIFLVLRWSGGDLFQKLEIVLLNLPLKLGRGEYLIQILLNHTFLPFIFRCKCFRINPLQFFRGHSHIGFPVQRNIMTFGPLHHLLPISVIFEFW